MKTVSKCFKAGTLCATIWLVTALIGFIANIIMEEASYHGSLIFLVIKLISVLAGLAAQVLIFYSIISYMMIVIEKYDKEQEQEKNKLDFEKEKEN